MGILFVLFVVFMLLGCVLGSVGEEVFFVMDKKEEICIVYVKIKEFKVFYFEVFFVKLKVRIDIFVVGIFVLGGVFLLYFYENGWDGNVIDFIFELLVKLDKMGKFVLVFVESWKIFKD